MPITVRTTKRFVLIFCVKFKKKIQTSTLLFMDDKYFAYKFRVNIFDKHTSTDDGGDEECVPSVKTGRVD